LAKNFEDFIFRSLLKTTIKITNEHGTQEIDLIQEQNPRTALHTMFQTHKKYLDETKGEIVSSIYERPQKKNNLTTLQRPYGFYGL